MSCTIYYGKKVEIAVLCTRRGSDLDFLRNIIIKKL